MGLKIGGDLGRFKDIVRGKVKNGLDKFIASDDIIGQVGGKLIKIPLKYIDLPRFAFGNKDKGGPGMGKGDPGDPMDPGDNSSGKGKAGDEDGEDSLGVEFTPEELATILSEHLELPFLENKGKGTLSAEKNKYNKISPQGSDSLRHFKRSYKEALKRQVSDGSYNPKEPKIIPIRDDFRYKSFSNTPAPDINAAAIYIIDTSGSMQEEQKHLVRSSVFWIDLLLKKAYGKIDSLFITHDTKAQEVNREEFFTLSTNGGTHISSAYELLSEIMETRYPFANYNVYPFHWSDGDNSGEADDDKCIAILKDKIIPNCNQFSYGNVNSPYGSADFVGVLTNKFADEKKLITTTINGVQDILPSIKHFFENGR
jgi:uncharacterized protein